MSQSEGTMTETWPSLPSPPENSHSWWEVAFSSSCVQHIYISTQYL